MHKAIWMFKAVLIISIYQTKGWSAFFLVFFIKYIMSL
jgi:hypothetical protein